MAVKPTKVTVEYQKGGETFTVDFDPKHVRSIVLHKDDLNKALACQHFHTLIAPSQNVFKENAQDTDYTGAAITNQAAAPPPPPDEENDPNRGLWWHTSTCDWFHPD